VATLLQVSGLEVGYGHVGVLRGVELAVIEGDNRGPGREQRRR